MNKQLLEVKRLNISIEKAFGFFGMEVDYVDEPLFVRKIDGQFKFGTAGEFYTLEYAPVITASIKEGGNSPFHAADDLPDLLPIGEVLFLLTYLFKIDDCPDRSKKNLMMQGRKKIIAAAKAAFFKSKTTNL